MGNLASLWTAMPTEVCCNILRNHAAKLELNGFHHLAAAIKESARRLEEGASDVSAV